MSTFEIPLTPEPQTFDVDLAGRGYTIDLEWHNGWTLALSRDGVRLVSSIPLVTGTDLLGQYGYLEIGGALVIASDNEPLAEPTQANIGKQSKLYFVTP